MARARAIDTRLEKLIPSTDELFVAGILTREEIQQLVKDRTHHEYKLVARPLLLVDVRNAITFELALEKKIADFCAEFNRKAALEASGVDENGKKKAKSGAPIKKLKLKHRWAVQERIEQIYKIGLRHLFTQRKTASLLQLKRTATLTVAPLTGVSKKDKAAVAEPMDDYEVLRRECVAQLNAFGRQVSLSKLYAEWLTRAPQDAFLWSEAALFEATHGRNDEARAIIQQALATLRQTSSATVSGNSASTGAVKVAGKDFLKQRASEESKEVWGTALVIEILFAKRLLEGAIETAVRANDKTPADSLRGENAALAAIVLDLALAEAIVSEAAQPASEGHLPFLCPDLGLYLYSVAVSHQFTAGLCRSILLQTLAVATKHSASSSSTSTQYGSLSAITSTSGPVYNPLSTLLTELFLTDIRFSASNCVTAEQFILEKTLSDLALLEGKSNGDELRREWVVRQLHRKHRVVPLQEKKEKVLASVGAALILTLAIDTAEKAIRKTLLDKSQIDAIIAHVEKSVSNDDDDDNIKEAHAGGASLFTALLRTILASAAARSSASSVGALSSLGSLRSALSDAIVELMSLSTDLAPIHLDDAQDALRTYDEFVKETKAAEKEKKAKALAKLKKGDAGAEESDSEDLVYDPEAFLATTQKDIFLFSQSESSKILRVVLLLERTHNGVGKRKSLSIVMAFENAVKNVANFATQKNKKIDPKSSVDPKKEAVATLELFRELCVSATILQTVAKKKKKNRKNNKNDNNNNNEAASSEDESLERANRLKIIKIGRSGAQLLKSFAEVAFANVGGDSVSVISEQSVNLAAAAGYDASSEDNLDGVFEEDVSPVPLTLEEKANNLDDTPAFSREELWWYAMEVKASAADQNPPAVLSIIDTKFLSVRMIPSDLVTFLSVAQPKTTAAASLNITTREEVAVHVSRVLALIDNQAALLGSSDKFNAELSAISKAASAIQALVCTPNAAGVYLPYEPSVWRLFATVQHALGIAIRKSLAKEASTSAAKDAVSRLSAIGQKTVREDDSSDSDDDEDKKRSSLPMKKKLRIGNNGATASSSASSATTAAATSIITQRDALGVIISDTLAALNTDEEDDDNNAGRKRTKSSVLVGLARRLFHSSLQFVAAGSSHASLPTFDLRAERLKGILALATIETIREMELAIDACGSTTAPVAEIPFNSPAIFLAAQALRLQKLLHVVSANVNTASQVHALLIQLTRIHNLLLPPIRILELEQSHDALSHGFSTPITRALLRNILIPSFGAMYVAASAVEKTTEGTKKMGLVVAAEKVIHSLLSQLTSLYIVEVKEAGKFGNGVRNSTQYAVVQKKEVSDYVAQNRAEAFLPYFFVATATEGGFAAPSSTAAAASSASITKANIINAQVNDWLLALVFEQQYTKNLAEARSIHSRAVQTVEAPQAFLASVAAGSLPALF